MSGSRSRDQSFPQALRGRTAGPALADRTDPPNRFSATAPLAARSAHRPGCARRDGTAQQRPPPCAAGQDLHGRDRAPPRPADRVRLRQRPPPPGPPGDRGGRMGRRSRRRGRGLRHRRDVRHGRARRSRRDRRDRPDGLPGDLGTRPRARGGPQRGVGARHRPDSPGKVVWFSLRAAPGPAAPHHPVLLGKTKPVRGPARPVPTAVPPEPVSAGLSVAASVGARPG